MAEINQGGAMTQGYNVERIITRQNNTGMHHLRLDVNGKLYSNEQCNL